MTPEKFISVINGVRFIKDDEKKVQERISKLFPEALREYILNSTDTIDFIFLRSGLGIEVKIKGQKRAVLKQIERYAKSSAITSIVLVTGMAIGLPRELNNKPIFKFNINQSWL